MSRISEARVQWLLPESGGRSKPPTGPKFAIIAKFEALQEQFEYGSWTVVLQFDTPVDESLTHVVHLAFLAPGAPADVLFPGSRFELFEGPQLVATGIVLDSPSDG